MSEIKGIIPLLKPPGFTSHDCVGKLRKLLHIKRIGHTGTLDPSVTGVLPLCIGQATRVVEYLQDLPKEYVGTMVLGKSTNTEDADGEIIEEKPVESEISEEAIQQMLGSFIGTIEQIPPMFSAVKVKGVRLHELARKGEEIERSPRKIKIYELEPLSMSLKQEYPEVTFRVKCSKGTYIRTLCVDMGKKLGYPAHMKGLQRTASGPFKLKDCYTFEQIEEYIQQNRFQEILKPIDLALQEYPSWIVSESEVQDVYNGKRIGLTLSVPEGQLIRVYSSENQFLALYRVLYEGQKAWGKPEKVFRD